LHPDKVHAWLNGLLPARPALVFDIDAVTGRDAAWLAGRGHAVVAIEPSKAMRRHRQQLHQDGHIRWLDDRLPWLATTLGLGSAADVILLSAVWQHLPLADRPRAFRKFVTLLKPGGLLAITPRHGPAKPERCVCDVSPQEIERLARGHGLVEVHISRAKDNLSCPGTSWTQMALRLFDDRTQSSGHV
jgi:SAM-dependent methyltransferase